tara:strand:- start:26302 stop:26439 length:138 start_codon:yes stop_codon:yes gene_type:complete
MIGEVLFALIIIMGLFFGWEILVAKFPDLFTSNYNIGKDGGDSEE